MFPSSLDDLSTTRASSGSNKLNSPDHLIHHAREDSILQAIEAKIGIDGSAVATSLDYLLKNANSINPGHKHNFLSALDGSPAQAVYVDNQGNVGIGTTNPGKPFEVYTANSNTNVRFGTFGTAGSAGLTFSPNNIDRWTIGVPADNSATPDLYFTTGAYVTNPKMVILSGGNVGIGTTSPTISGTGKFDMNADTFRLRTARTPATAGAAGNAGEMCWDNGYLYVCVAANTWLRAAITTWV